MSERLDIVLMARHHDFSRSRIKGLIEAGFVKVNGEVVTKAGAKVDESDTLDVFIPPPVPAVPEPEDIPLDVLYEDEHILIVDKKPGLMVHPDRTEQVNTLLTHVQAYLYQKGEYDPRAEGAFAPVPVNRIDRFTAGLVLFARTEAAMRVLNQKIRDREIDKRYLCITLGAPRPAAGSLEHYIQKNTRRVTVLDRPAPGAQRAVTSPTFCIVSEHPAPEFLVVHMDLYRLQDEEDVLQIGWEDYLARGAVLVVEWPDRAGSLIPANAKHVRFAYGTAETGRVITVDGMDGSI